MTMADQTAGPPGEPASAVAQDGVPPPQPAAEPRIHIYDAVSTQRDKVLKGFDGQRAAVLKAVADQRAAVLAPIMAVNARQVAQPRAAPVNNPVPPPSGKTSNAGDIKTGVRKRRRTIDPRAAVAARFIAFLKTLVAAEVKAQLEAALAKASASRETEHAISDEREPKVTGPE